MYLIYLLMILYVVKNGQSCNEGAVKCKTSGVQCVCTGLTCIPGNNSCEASTTEVVLVNSLIFSIPKNAFLMYNGITFLAISGFVGIIEPGAFNGLNEVEILRINSFSLGSSSKAWSVDINSYIAYLNGLSGLQAIAPGTLNTLPSMTSLDLNFNRINNVYPEIFDGIRSLEELGLAGNAIQQFQEKAFEEMPRLKSLYMSKNVISHLVFRTNSLKSIFRHLETLDLFGNQLTTFPSFVLRIAPAVFDLDLRENPLACDCNTIDFLKNSGPHQQVIGLDPTCNVPEKKCSAPILLSSFKEFNVPPGESILLAFDVKGQPHPLVSISGPDGLPRVGVYNINTNQVIVDLNIENDEDFGTYTCTATNSYGTAELAVVVKKRQSTPTTTKVAKSRTSAAEHTTSHCTWLYLLTFFMGAFILS